MIEGKTDQTDRIPEPDPISQRNPRSMSLMETLDHQFEQMFGEPPVKK